jgi:hypothetical protein
MEIPEDVAAVQARLRFAANAVSVNHRPPSVNGCDCGDNPGPRHSGAQTVLQIVRRVWHSQIVTEAAPSPRTAKPAKAKAKAALNAKRSFWLKQLHSWHWISAAVSLVGMILFAATGITLNHAAAIPGTPVTVEQTATLPAPLLQRLASFPQETTDPVPDAVARWASEALKVEIAGKPTETTAQEVYVALAMPGGDGWVTIDRATGETLHAAPVPAGTTFLQLKAAGDGRLLSLVSDAGGTFLCAVDRATAAATPLPKSADLSKFGTF